MKTRTVYVIMSVLAVATFMTPNRVSAQAIDSSWTAAISVQIDTIEFELLLGGRPNATDRFDAGIDVIAPPPPISSPYAAFSIPVFPNNLQADYRKPDTTHVWDLRVVNTFGTSYRVSWDLNDIPTYALASIADSEITSRQNSMEFTGDQIIKFGIAVVPPRNRCFLPSLFSINGTDSAVLSSAEFVMNSVLII